MIISRNLVIGFAHLQACLKALNLGYLLIYLPHDVDEWMARYRTLKFLPIFINKILSITRGLRINLDWFQPYDGAIYSTGVLYAAICNLPRNVRFRPENMLILGILPGPNEVSLHKINHYLSPIVTELESLWEGVVLSRTDECPSGKNI